MSTGLFTTFDVNKMSSVMKTHLRHRSRLDSGAETNKTILQGEKYVKVFQLMPNDLDLIVSSVLQRLSSFYQCDSKNFPFFQGSLVNFSTST